MQSKRNFRVVLLGGPDVGKTLLMLQFAGKVVDYTKLKPSDTYESIISTKTVDGVEESFTISTIPGKQMADVNSFEVVKNADAIIFVLDINDYKTLSDTEIYFYEIGIADKKLPSFIIANKNDIPTDAKFPFKEVEELASSLNIRKSYLTSGLNTVDLARVFSDMVKLLKKERGLKIPEFNPKQPVRADGPDQSGDESCKIF